MRKKKKKQSGSQEKPTGNGGRRFISRGSVETPTEIESALQLEATERKTRTMAEHRRLLEQAHRLPPNATHRRILREDDMQDAVDRLKKLKAIGAIDQQELMNALSQLHSGAQHVPDKKCDTCGEIVSTEIGSRASIYEVTVTDAFSLEQYEWNPTRKSKLICGECRGDDIKAKNPIRCFFCARTLSENQEGRGFMVMLPGLDNYKYCCPDCVKREDMTPHELARAATALEIAHSHQSVLSDYAMGILGTGPDNGHTVEHYGKYHTLEVIRLLYLKYAPKANLSLPEMTFLDTMRNPTLVNIHELPKETPTKGTIEEAKEERTQVWKPRKTDW